MTDDSDSLSSFAENRIKSLELELSNTKEQLHFLQQSNDNLRRSSISLVLILIFKFLIFLISFSNFLISI